MCRADASVRPKLEGGKLMDITNLTVHELKEKLDKKETTISEINKAYVERI